MNLRTGSAMGAWAALILLTLAACGSGQSSAAAPRPSATLAAVPATPSGVPPNVPDFPVVAYQGDQAFGGHDGHFSAAFAAGRPVVLLYFAGL